MNQNHGMQSDSVGLSLLQILSGDLPSTSGSPLLRHLVIGAILSGIVQKIFPDGKALVNFNNQNVLVNSNKKLQPGQNLTARVERLTPHPQLKLIINDDLPSIPGRESRPSGSYEQAPDYKTQLSFPKKVSTPATFNIEELKRFDLVPNKEYKARVSQVDKQSIVLELKGKQFALPVNNLPENKGPAPGTAIVVKFEKNAENNFSLVRQGTIAGPAPLTREALIPYLSAHETLPKMIGRLEKAVQAVKVSPLNLEAEILVDIQKTLQQLRPPAKGQLPNAEQIRRQVQVSGVNYEANVEKVLRENSNVKLDSELQPALKNDLKGQILKIINSLEPLANGPGLPDFAPRNVSNLLGIFQQAVDNIELHQLNHRLALLEQEPIVLQIPNPFSSEQAVKIYVRQLQDADKDKNKKEHKGFNLVFILNMSALGNVKIDARLQDKNLQVQIQVEKPALVKFVEGRLEELSAVMKEMGFFAEMSCCLQEKVEIEFTDTIRQLMIEKQTYRVDIQT